MIMVINANISETFKCPRCLNLEERRVESQVR